MTNVMRKFAIGAVLAAALAVTACDDGTEFGEGTGPNPTLPAPAGLQAVTQGNGVAITWGAVTGAVSYRLERTTSAAPGVFEQVGGTLAATTYQDDAITPGVTYGYRVAAVNANGVGTFSNTASVAIAGLRERTLTGIITTSQTLRKDTTYYISGFVKIANNSTLTIEPGTRLVGDKDVAGSSLWILRGSRIVANGTQAEPIVFTSEFPAGQRRPGDWGGIVVIGNGVINRTSPNQTEGPAGVTENYGGGTNNADNSGTLRYVRIEFAGFDVNGQGQELNSLSMYAVGSGTTVEYVQTLAGLDDAFEWWGGAVDGRYLISYETGDDHFDWSEGYRGRNQFLIAFQSTRLLNRAGSGGNNTDSQGFEADGCSGSNCIGGANNFDAAPFAVPVFANFTVVGPGTGVTAQPAGDIGLVMRRGTGGYLANGIIARWAQAGMTVRDAQTLARKTADSLRVNNVLFAQNGAGGTVAYATEAANRAPAAEWTAANHRSQASIDGIFASLTTSSFDWRPAGGSPAATGGSGTTGGAAIPTNFKSNFFGGTLAETNFVGAADPAAQPWWTGWTNYATN